MSCWSHLLHLTGHNVAFKTLLTIHIYLPHSCPLKTSHLYLTYRTNSWLFWLNTFTCHLLDSLYIAFLIPLAPFLTLLILIWLILNDWLFKLCDLILFVFDLQLLPSLIARLWYEFLTRSLNINGSTGPTTTLTLMLQLRSTLEFNRIFKHVFMTPLLFRRGCDKKTNIFPTISSLRYFVQIL